MIKALWMGGFDDRPSLSNVSRLSHIAGTYLNSASMPKAIKKLGAKL